MTTSSRRSKKSKNKKVKIHPVSVKAQPQPPLPKDAATDNVISLDPRALTHIEDQIKSKAGSLSEALLGQIGLWAGWAKGSETALVTMRDGFNLHMEIDPSIDVIVEWLCKMSITNRLIDNAGLSPKVIKSIKLRALKGMVDKMLSALPATKAVVSPRDLRGSNTIGALKRENQGSQSQVRNHQKTAQGHASRVGRTNGRS